MPGGIINPCAFAAAPDMHPMPTGFTPTRQAGLDRLAAASPRLGNAYAAGRNLDPGPDAPPTTAALSPWLRHRLLLEEEVARAALAEHGPASDKFVQEVFWRAYFKGWLETHPAAWEGYRRQAEADRNRLAVEGGLRRVHDDACAGRTGIECFDAWAAELVGRNWLHNHARMWFASIWIFTLRLPWTLGCEFFARHLLDGDAASNTLSWRWVAGLHTRGKHYVARAENIHRYTDGRFDPAGQLDEDPAPLQESTSPAEVRPPAPDAVPDGDVWLLLHDEDLVPETLALGGRRVRGVAALCTHPALALDGTAVPVTEFARAATADALDRAGRHFGVPAAVLDGPQAVAGWAGGPVVAPHAPVGPAAEALAACGVPVARLVREWDARTWPYAARGYFKLRSRIPALVQDLGLG